jgi:hypothetical protein
MSPYAFLKIHTHSSKAGTTELGENLRSQVMFYPRNRASMGPPNSVEIRSDANTIKQQTHLLCLPYRQFSALHQTDDPCASSLWRHLDRAS